MPSPRLRPHPAARTCGRAEGGAAVVQGKTVSLCALTDEAFLDFLCSDAFEKRAFDAKPLYRAALDAGREAANITLDAKLAAYLLNPSARGYDIAALEAEYGIAPPFVCADVPEAGAAEALFERLADKCEADGMGALLRDIEQPLCEVLADMEFRGIGVDREGIEAFGRELQTALDAGTCGGVRGRGV